MDIRATTAVNTSFHDSPCCRYTHCTFAEHNILLYYFIAVYCELSYYMYIITVYRGRIFMILYVFVLVCAVKREWDIFMIYMTQKIHSKKCIVRKNHIFGVGTNKKIHWEHKAIIFFFLNCTYIRDKYY